MKKILQQLTTELIRFKTVTGDRDEMNRCFSYITDYLQEKPAQIFEHNGVQSFLYTRSAEVPEVIFHGHVDVVPVNDDAEFEPRLIADRLYGRGALDMKGGCAVMIEAYKNTRSPRLGLLLTADEEVGGFNGAGYVASQGFVPRCFISGEPTHLKIGNQSKGVLQLEIVTHGKQGHSAYAWMCDNAVHKKVRAMARILEKYNANIENEECWETSVNFNYVTAGVGAFNVVPGVCSLRVDVRFVPHDDVEAIISDFREAFPDSDINIVHKEAAVFTPPEDMYMSALSRVTNNTLFVQKHGASDIRHFRQRGSSTATFGPSGAGMHADDEYVELESLVSMYDALTAFLQK